MIGHGTVARSTKFKFIVWNVIVPLLRYLDCRFLQTWSTVWRWCNWYHLEQNEPSPVCHLHSPSSLSHESFSTRTFHWRSHGKRPSRHETSGLTLSVSSYFPTNTTNTDYVPLKDHWGVSWCICPVLVFLRSNYLRSGIASSKASAKIKHQSFYKELLVKFLLVSMGRIIYEVSCSFGSGVLNRWSLVKKISTSQHRSSSIFSISIELSWVDLITLMSRARTGYAALDQALI